MRNRISKNYKFERINSEISKIIQEVITYEIKDPRVCGNATVSEVIVSRDLSYCKVYVQIIENDKEEVMEGLKNARGYVRHAIADSLDLRKIPEINFILDDSMDRAKRIEELLKQIK